MVRKYNLNVLVTLDSEVKSYIKKIIGQLHKWLLHGKIKKLVVVIVSKNSGETIEKWQFDVNILNNSSSSSSSSSSSQSNNNNIQEKSDEIIQKEIQAIIRQITASITFLPVLDPGDCTFNVQVYADSDAQVPVEWADSEARDVKNAEQVQLRSFSTNSHEINTLVAYRLGGNDD